MSELYIDTSQALSALCAELRCSPWLALDTEFIREKTYYPQLCLIQVADAERLACIDPLAISHLDPLLEILYDPSISKVLHSAQQDLEIFFNLRGKVPAPVFDTQIAATLLGQGEQVGYASLVKALLGVELDKSQTRTDWSRRPLDDAQIAYAAADVRYLRDVYRRQCAELESRGRLAWLADDFSGLCNPENYRVHPAEAWRRIKGHQQLRGVQLAVLQALAAWREERARVVDKPRKWVLSDDLLLELARHRPKDEESLKRLRSLNASSLKRHASTLLELIAKTSKAPRESWPKPPSRRLQLSPQQDALVDAMMAVVRLRGSQKAISSQALASRKDLERLLVNETDIPLLRGWRAAVAGSEVQALLRGALRLEVRNGELCTVMTE